jgi:hypothetical protein
MAVFPSFPALRDLRAESYFIIFLRTRPVYSEGMGQT